MAKSYPQIENTTALAATVRNLARDARHVLTDPGVSDGAYESLLERIDSLRETLGANDQTPIRRWLESLRREVEAAELPALT